MGRCCILNRSIMKQRSYSNTQAHFAVYGKDVSESLKQVQEANLAEWFG